MKYAITLLMLLYSCGERVEVSTTSPFKQGTVTQQTPLQKHSHLTLAQQAHQDPKKSAELRKQIVYQKDERREAYRKNMEQRKKQIQRIAETKE